MLKKKRLIKRISLILITLLIYLIQISSTVLAASGNVSKIADGNTMQSYQSSMLGGGNSGSNQYGSRYAGRLWSDKSVFSNNGDKAFISLNTEDDGIYDNTSVETDSDFLHVYSALGSSQITTTAYNAPLDVVLTLDVSQSMAAVVNYVAMNENYNGPTPNPYNSFENSRINTTCEAINNSIKYLMESNNDNRVALIIYGGYESVILPLGRYYSNTAHNDFKILTALPADNWSATNESSNFILNVTAYNENNTNYGLNGLSKRSWTNFQAAVFEAGQILGTTNQTIKDYGNGIKVSRIPVIMLMTDGASNVVTANNGNNNSNWFSPEKCFENDRSTLLNLKFENKNLFAASNKNESNNNYNAAGVILTDILTGSYVKSWITNHYKNEASKLGISARDVQIYTIGVDIDATLKGNGPDSPWGISRLLATLDPSNYFIKDPLSIAQESFYGYIKKQEGEESTPHLGEAQYKAIEIAYRAWEDWENKAIDFKNQNIPNGTQGSSINNFVSGTTGSLVSGNTLGFNLLPYTLAQGGYRPGILSADGKSYSSSSPDIITNQDIINNKNYVNQNYNVDDIEQIKNVFNSILNTIDSSIFVPIEGTNGSQADEAFSYVDPVGEYMTVESVDNVLLFGNLYDTKLIGSYDKTFEESNLYKQEGWYLVSTILDSETNQSIIQADYGENGELPNKGNFNNTREAIRSGWKKYINLETIMPYLPFDINSEDQDKLNQTSYTAYSISGLGDTSYSQTDLDQLRWNPSYGIAPTVMAYGDNGVYRLSDIFIWGEDIGDYNTENNSPVFDGSYEESFHVQIPASALPLQVATITEKINNNKEEYTYKTNLGADNNGDKSYYAQSTPVRVFYSVNLEGGDDGILNENNEIDLSKVNPNYFLSHTETEKEFFFRSTDKVYFLSNYYSKKTADDVYRNTLSDSNTLEDDNLKFTVGNPVTTFSPSKENRYYIFQKNHLLYKIENPDENATPLNPPDEFEIINYDFKSTYSIQDDKGNTYKVVDANTEVKSTDWFYMVVDYYVPQTASVKDDSNLGVPATHTYRAVARQAKEFGSGIGGEYGQYLTWYQPQSNEYIDFNKPSAGPTVDRSKFYLATKYLGLRTGDMFSNTVFKNTKDGQYYEGAANNTNTSSSFYYPMVYETTNGANGATDTIINSYLGNNGKLSIEVDNTPASITLNGKKIVNNTNGGSFNLENHPFSFTLSPSQDNPESDPIKDRIIYNESPTDNQAIIKIFNGNEKYTEPGAFIYTLCENPIDTYPGVTNSQEVYKITVKVSYNQEYKLEAKITSITNSEDKELLDDNTDINNVIEFINTFDKQSIRVGLDGTKKVIDGSIANQKFSFTVTGDETNSPEPLEEIPGYNNETKSLTVSNNLTGHIQFYEDLTFELDYDDLTSENLPKTFTYYIEEVDTNLPNIVYDSTTYKVIYTVSLDENGAIQAVPSILKDNTETVKNIEFSNTLISKKLQSPENDKQVAVGELVTYTIDWSNNTGETADIQIVDPLNKELDFVSADHNGVYVSNPNLVDYGITTEINYSYEGAVVWTFKEVENGTSGTVTLVARVNENALTDGNLNGNIENTSFINQYETNTVTTPVYDPEITKEEKTPGPGETVRVGTTITYTISYTNNSDQPANVVIKDPIDQGLTFVEASDNGTYNPTETLPGLPEGETIDYNYEGVVTWNFTDVPAGKSITVALTVTVNENARIINLNSVYDKALVSVDNGTWIGTEEIENPLGENNKIEQTPGNGKKVNVGELITYSISYKNSTDDTATITIKDPLDKGLTFYSATENGTYDENEILSNMNIPNSYDYSGVVTWTIENVPSRGSGEVELIVKVNENARINDIVYNEAFVKVANGNWQITDMPENPLGDNNKEIISPEDGDMVYVGQEIVYKINYENTTSTTQDIHIYDPIDKGLTYTSSDPSGTYVSGAILPTGVKVDYEYSGVVEWNISNVEPYTGSSITVYVTVNEEAREKEIVKDQAVIEIDNTFILTEEVQNELGNNSKVETDPGDGKFVIVDQEITYEISYQNTTNQEQTITIVDPLDKGVTFVSASNKGTYDKNGKLPDSLTVSYDYSGTVTWTINNVAPKDVGTVTLTVKVNDDAKIKDKVYDQAFIQLGKNGPWTPTEIPENPLAQNDKEELSPGNGNHVAVGDIITYSISYQNYTDQKATVRIIDPLDEGLTFIKASDEGTYKENDSVPEGIETSYSSHGYVEWNIDNVEPGTKGNVELTVRVNENAKLNEDKEVLNQAFISFDNSNWIETSIPENPIGENDKTETSPGNGKGVYVGKEIEYKISYENITDQPTTITINDPLDIGLTLVEASDGGELISDETLPAGYSVDYEYQGIIRWIFTNVEPGQVGTVTVKARVNDNYKESIVKNQAFIQIDNSPWIVTEEMENPIPDNNKTETNPGNGKSVLVGQEITYEISYINVNDQDTTITIIDPIDNGLDFISATDGGEYLEEGLLPDGLIVDYDYNGYVKWELQVKAEDSGTVNLTVKVNDKANIVDVVKNQSFIQIDNNQWIITDEMENPLRENNKIEISPGNKHLVVVGQTITYKIAYENSTAEPATITIIDPLDKGLTFKEASENGEYQESVIPSDYNIQVDYEYNGYVKWVIESVPAYGKGFVTLDVTVNTDSKNVDESGDVLIDTVFNQAFINIVDNEWIPTDVPQNPIGENTKIENMPGSGKDVYVGETIEYSIFYENNTDTTANIKVIDALDTGLTYVSSNPEGVYEPEASLPDDLTVDYSCSGIITWTIDDVTPGTGGEIVVTVKVNDSAIDIVRNRAFIQIDNNNWIPTDEPFNNLGEFSKVETTPGSGKSVIIGDEITYTITYENVLDELATITIYDPLDIGLNFVSSDPESTYDIEETLPEGYSVDYQYAGIVKWIIPNVEANSKGQVSLTVRVNDKAKIADIVKDQAFVQINDESLQPTEEVENPLAENNKVEVTPGDGQKVIVGEIITYNISYENTTEDVIDIQIIDPLDVGLTFVSASHEGIYDDTATLSDDLAVNYDYKGLVTWTLKEVESGVKGTVKLTVRVNDNAKEELIVKNQAFIQLSDKPWIPTDEPQNELGENNKVETTPGDKERVFIGEEITYEISYENTSANTTTITIVDPLDKGLTFVSASNNGSYNSEETLPRGLYVDYDYIGVVTWSIPDVPAGGTGTVSLTVFVNNQAKEDSIVKDQAFIQIGNSIWIPTDEPENLLGDNEKTELTPGDGNSVTVGDTITYSIVYENVTNLPIDIVIVDPLDVGLTFVSASDLGEYYSEQPLPEGQTIDYEFQGAVVWKLLNVPAHTSGTVTLTAKVNDNAKQTQVVRNQAFIQLGNNPWFTTDEPENPLGQNNKIEITPGNESSVMIGETITYNISYENLTDTNATITIIDPLDKGLTFVSASNEGIYDENGVLPNDTKIDYEYHGTVTWIFEDVKPGEKGTVLLTVEVNENAKDLDIVKNQAFIQLGENNPWIPTDEPENPLGDNNKEEITPGNNQRVLVGDTITYEISYENTTANTASITIMDPLDKGLTFASASDNGTYSATETLPSGLIVDYDYSGIVTWTIPNVASGGTGKVILTVTVNEEAKVENIVKDQSFIKIGNNSWIATDEPENPLGENSKVEITPGSGEKVKVDNTITYSISYENVTNEIKDITIVDPLDIGVTFVSATDGGTYNADETLPSGLSVNYEYKGLVTWTLAGVEPNITGSVSLTVKVNEKAKDIIIDQSFIQIGNSSWMPTDEVENPTEIQDDVTIEKYQSLDSGGMTKDPLLYKSGQTVNYYLVVNNPTSVTLKDIEVKDTIPEGLTLISSSISNNGSYNERTNTITWNISSLNSGESITLSYSAQIPTDVNNTDDYVNIGYLTVNDETKPSNEVLIEKDIQGGASGNPNNPIDDSTTDVENPSGPGSSTGTNNPSGSINQTTPNESGSSNNSSTTSTSNSSPKTGVENYGIVILILIILLAVIIMIGVYFYNRRRNN